MGLRDAIVFLRESAGDFHHVGAVAPSSRWLARALAADIDPSLGPLRVLEVGAGTGAFTREIVRRLPHGSQIEIVERNDRFARLLERELEEAAAEGIDHRVLREDFLTAPLAGGYDRVISGLPLNNFSPEEVVRILEHAAGMLAPGGRFSWFEYLGIRALKSLVSSADQRRRLRGVGAAVEGFLERNGAGRHIVWANLPPAVVHRVRPDHGAPGE